jgi:hypothetical protein
LAEHWDLPDTGIFYYKDVVTVLEDMNMDFRKSVRLNLVRDGYDICDEMIRPRNQTPETIFCFR